ncbi:LegC family aminotransferase [Neomoorella thermoacetica]|uniref:LegC family aminotransferase n=1 Tax=Neomoorella thermoacetica TaxID=1525 RepID=UPI0008FA593F|nr:LegC family aminotransferase [Moorella thermoacetica]OIQ12543.1 putative pyridoxal phosphate-dependent aminotransferase EpsN [Moorella thermoacetica]
MQEIKIPLDWPNISELERDYILKALASGYVSSAGPLVREFEQRFAAYLGIGHAVAVVNGTAGLHLALKLLGIGPGDEVIVPALTFIATVNPVVYVGARPVVVDVDPRTWNLDPAAIEKAITKHTRAIIPVHLYGNPADMDAILGLAREYGLYVIEDATEALGSTYKGKKAGTFGHIGVFSFNGNKIITTGGGGMLVTEDPELARRARILVNQGREPGEIEYEHKEIGFNYRLTNLQAALGLAQLERLPEFLATKRRNAAIYCRELRNISGIGWQEETPGAESNWWLFSIVVYKEKYGLDRQKLMKHLQNRGIQVRPLFKPVNLQQCYKAYSFNHCPTAKALYTKGLNIPSASFLQEKEIIRVIGALREV